MLGVQRRQLYKLIEGGSTTPDREARIRAVDEVVTDLCARFGDHSAVRSCLLAPLDAQLRSFVDLAADGDIRVARDALWAYLEQRGDRPVPLYIERPRKSTRRGDTANFVRDTRDIAPGR